MGTPFRNHLRRVRTAQHLRQADLAALAGISRQRMAGLEAGQGLPSLEVALRLSRTLAVPIEQLFQAERTGALPVTVAGVGADVDPDQVPRRMALAEVERAWIAWPLSASEPAGQLGAADGLLQRRKMRGKHAEVEPLRDLGALRLNLVALGCDPALAVLSSQLAEQANGPRLRWIDAPSEQALDALAAGTAHLAGCHLLDEESGEFNVHAVRARFPKTDMLVVSLAKWPVGLVVAPGNPKGLRGAGDLARRGVSIINRPRGAEARRLLDRELKKAGVKPARVRGYARVARSHQEVAQAVALGGADAGVAPVATALAWGLSFIELSEERFDLVLPLARASDPKIDRLLEVLGSDRFERELQALPGYDPTCAGEVVAELRAQP